MVFGDYRERHYFPYILTAILSGHVCERFGKLYLIKGDGNSWDTPKKITKDGRFSCSHPQICLNDEIQHVHFIWEDERLGYRNKAIFYDSFHENRFEGNRKISIDLANPFAPFIACDNKDNLYVVWSTFERNDIGKLYFRYRIDNSWSEAIELADRSVINSISTDTFGNIHFVWGDGAHIFYKIKCESFWTKTIKIDGQKARFCIDKKNDAHLVIQKIRGSRYYVLMHNIFRFKR